MNDTFNCAVTEISVIIKNSKPMECKLYWFVSLFSAIFISGIKEGAA